MSRIEAFSSSGISQEVGCSGGLFPCKPEAVVDSWAGVKSSLLLLYIKTSFFCMS